jgi:asparagine synthetase A
MPFRGGLLDHLMKVAKYAVQINRFIPQNMRIAESSIFKVAFLCEIGKTNLYKFNESEWHRKNQGKMYEFNEDLVSMRVGERSAFLAISNGVELLAEEFQAIVNHDKPCDDMQARWHSSILAQILRQAIDLAIMEEKYQMEEEDAVA